MTYTRQGDHVTLEMTRDDFDRLLIMVGCACGNAMRIGGSRQFYSWLEFANELNNGNPDFTPYEIPEEYRTPQQGGASNKL
jgi:hypothetical protein